MTQNGTAAHDDGSLDGLLPGDGIALPDGERAAVQTLYRCHETIEQVTVVWRWAVLTDGHLLEIAPRGCALYDPPTRIEAKSARFQDLVAQDGVLVRFEERVRDGTWRRRPLQVRFNGRRWRVTSTGTATSRRLGDEPAACWRTLGVRDEPDVYFTLAAADDPLALGLGLWTTDICLAFGRRLGSTAAEAGLRRLDAP
ncbi:MAG: hypothetical protein IT305_00355 [Chloroflexi bacterium]|nr:hypothetical protein [Chloroflexota bacterium]